MESARLLTVRSFDALLRQALKGQADGCVVLRDREGVRHGVWVERGYVVGVHVAGRYDPLLSRLQREGALSTLTLQRCLQAAAHSGARTGLLASAAFGVAPAAVRRALQLQAAERFVALERLAVAQGYDGWLERGPVPERERVLRLPLGSLERLAERTLLTADRTAARRTLRRLARQLHPDRDPRLDPGERARRSEELARATAAYHGFR